jgi:hypothetical protein
MIDSNTSINNHSFFTNNSKITNLSHLDSTANNITESSYDTYNSIRNINRFNISVLKQSTNKEYDTFCLTERIEKEYFTADQSRMVKQFIPIAVPKHKFSH